MTKPHPSVAAVVPAATKGWQQSGECFGAMADRLKVTDEHPFYPGAGRQGDSPPWREFCDRCTVRVDCLAYALRESEHYGVWGGMPERE